MYMEVYMSKLKNSICNKAAVRHTATAATHSISSEIFRFILERK